MGRRTWEGLEDFFAYGHFGGFVTASSWRVFVEFVMGGYQDRGPAGIGHGADWIQCRREALALDGQVWIERRKYQPCESGPRCSTQYGNSHSASIHPERQVQCVVGGNSTCLDTSRGPNKIAGNPYRANAQCCSIRLARFLSSRGIRGNACSLPPSPESPFFFRGYSPTTCILVSLSYPKERKSYAEGVRS